MLNLLCECFRIRAGAVGARSRFPMGVQFAMLNWLVLASPGGHWGWWGGPLEQTPRLLTAVSLPAGGRGGGLCSNKKTLRL